MCSGCIAEVCGTSEVGNMLISNMSQIEKIEYAIRYPAQENAVE